MKYNTKSFIKKAKEVHGDKYDYSKVNYFDSKIKITIICSKHGIFEQKPYKHLQKNGCPNCAKNKKQTTKEFIKKAKEVHGDKYDYSLVKYINNRTKVVIVCSKHGEFKQSPSDHMKKHGCKICAFTIISQEKMSFFGKFFIKKAKEIHDNKYDYSLVDYKNAKNKIKIICTKHGIFEQIPNYHLSGCGCPHCNESKGEKEIKRFLNKNNINYIFQKSFNDCKNKNNRKLKFDFYLPKNNIIIEYDGIQHYEPIKHFGGIKSFVLNKEYDKIKNEYITNIGIKLIRIPYFKYNKIHTILKDKLSK